MDVDEQKCGIIMQTERKNMFQLPFIKRSSWVAFLSSLIFAFSVRAEYCYTNHAGNLVLGCPVELTRTQVVLSEDAPLNQTTTDGLDGTFQRFNSSTVQPSTTAYPLSIFPESEQRRIAADFALRQGSGQVDMLRIPLDVKRAVEGAKRAIVRSRKRAEKGLCPKEESDAFCAQSAAALTAYLDKQEEKGVITQAERAALERP